MTLSPLRQRFRQILLSTDKKGARPGDGAGEHFLHAASKRLGCRA